jgi:ASCH domain
MCCNFVAEPKVEVDNRKFSSSQRTDRECSGAVDPPSHSPHSNPTSRESGRARLRALSGRQPWAWLIVNGVKDIVNRSFRTDDHGPLLIHAALSLDGYAENIKWVKRKYGISVPLEVDTGGIIGVVHVIDCVERHTSKWFEKGNFGWVLTNPRRLNFRSCKGALRLFRPKY